jgi:RNA polymerase sigma factor (sigma-70 family)
LNQRHRQIESLLSAHGRGLHALLLRLTLSPDAAEDLMQDLFIQLARSNGFAAAARPEAYAFKAAINLAMTWRRRNRRRTASLPLPAELADGRVSAIGSLIDAEDLHRALDALDDLPEEPRQIVVMRFIQSQSYHTIAQQIGKDAHTVRALCHKAIRRLRATLTPEQEVRRASD